jgi:DNA mismatch repair ATPase MutS
MKTFLMYKDRDFDLKQKPPANEQALTKDLELDTLLNAMARGDELLFEVSKSAMLSGIKNDLNTISYRQSVLKDCLRNPALVRDIYTLAVAAIEKEKENRWGILSDYPSAILHRSIDVLQMFVTMLRRLRGIAEDHADKFRSEGFTTFFAMLKRELGDEYFAIVNDHLRKLKFRGGVLISAELGEANKGANYVLRLSEANKQGLLERIFAGQPPSYSFYLHPRDESGARALSELNDRGIGLVANALAQSTAHILSFFSMLRTELAFYVACLNLHEQLVDKGEPVCFPLPAPSSERRHAFQGLYDICLSLRMKQRVVGNEANADRKDLVIITGANQGGKSTFLRSVGLAQLMMQCGMFGPAEFFASNVCDGLFTHYKREEDATMKSGKLDEELRRMSEIVGSLTSNSMVLFNESFAATNENEGSEIARQITSALLEKRVKMFFVTHLYDFAHSCFEQKRENAMFLRAERQADGGRTFKLIEADPLDTSYGEDLYKMIFVGPEAVPSAPSLK